MKKILFLFLLGAFFVSCTKKEAVYPFEVKENNDSPYRTEETSYLYRGDQKIPFNVLNFYPNWLEVNPNEAFYIDFLKMKRNEKLTFDFIQQLFPEQKIMDCLFSKDGNQVVVILDKSVKKTDDKQNVFLLDKNNGMKVDLGEISYSNYLFFPEIDVFMMGRNKESYNQVFEIVKFNKIPLFYTTVPIIYQRSENYESTLWFRFDMDLLEKNDLYLRYYDREEMEISGDLKITIPVNNEKLPKLQLRFFKNYMDFDISRPKEFLAFEKGRKILGRSYAERIRDYIIDDEVPYTVFAIKPRTSDWVYIQEKDNQLNIRYLNGFYRGGRIFTIVEDISKNKVSNAKLWFSHSKQVFEYEITLEDGTVISDQLPEDQ